MIYTDYEALAKRLDVYNISDILNDVIKSLKDARAEIKRLNHLVKVLEDDQQLNILYTLKLEDEVGPEVYGRCYKEALEEYELGKEDDK